MLLVFNASVEKYEKPIENLRGHEFELHPVQVRVCFESSSLSESNRSRLASKVLKSSSTSGYLAITHGTSIERENMHSCAL